MTAEIWPRTFPAFRDLAPEIEFQVRSIAGRTARAVYVQPEIYEVQPHRRRFLDRKVRPTVSEWSEARQLYYADGVEVWAIARMMHLSRQAVREIIFPWPG